MIATLTTENELFEGFNAASKVWIYSSDKPINDAMAMDINEKIAQFTIQWTAHDLALKATGTVLYNQFIILCVDESQTNASGCSIDKSVHFIKQIEQGFGLQLFDRLTIYYLKGEEFVSFHLNDILEKVGSSEINQQTKIFDATLTQLGALRTEFIKEAGNSWLGRFITTV
jgi:hypothetical protein